MLSRMSYDGIRRSVLSVALALALTPALAAESGTAARNEAVVRDAFGQWAAGGNVFPTLLARDVVWTIHGSGPVAGTYRGYDDFVERASRPLVSRMAKPIVPQIHHVWSVGDTVIVRFDGAGTTTGGQTYRNQFVWIMRMKEGRATEVEAFLDLVAYQHVVENNQPRTP